MAISFEFSDDPVLLAEYFSIREECFRSELGLPDFNGQRDCYDVPGSALIIRDGSTCIGGVRLTGCHLDTGLPVESESFRLRAVCRSFLQTQDRVCQWSRLAVKPAERNRVDVLKLCETLVDVARSQGYAYAFYVSGDARTRLFKKLHMRLGCDYQVLKSVQLPVEEGFERLPHLLSVARLDGQLIQAQPDCVEQVV